MKHDALTAVMDKLELLKTQYTTVLTEKDRIEVDYNDCLRRMETANRLIGGLGGERSRWTELTLDASESHENLLGDVVVCAAIIAYLGPFTPTYRHAAVSAWLEVMAARDLQCSEGFTLRAVLGEPMQLRDWTIAGLPSDPFSADNGIILFRSSFWPILIDPQGQAVRWIKMGSQPVPHPVPHHIPQPVPHPVHHHIPQPVPHAASLPCRNPYLNPNLDPITVPQP